jgi:hypothetical protein
MVAEHALTKKQTVKNKEERTFNLGLDRGRGDVSHPGIARLFARRVIVSFPKGRKVFPLR